MIKPIGDYVLVDVDKQDEQTQGGIILPTQKKDQPQTGTVIDISVNAAEKVLVDFKPGIKIWFKMWAGEDVEYLKEDKRVKFGSVKKKYKLIHLKDIIAFEGGEK